MTPDPNRAQDALRAILGWAEAYPVQTFPEPDLDALRRQIGDGPFSALHATWARHLLQGVARYARAGLGLTDSDLPTAGIRARLCAAMTYHDSRFPSRTCDACGTHYTGPAVYCSLVCAETDT